jgi:hypothetical protein
MGSGLYLLNRKRWGYENRCNSGRLDHLVLLLYETRWDAVYFFNFRAHFSSFLGQTLEFDWGELSNI